MVISVKTCFKCGAEKPLTDFYKHPRMPDGHVNKCKECNKRDVKDNREDKKDYYLEYDRNRFNAEQRNQINIQRTKFKYHSDENYKASILITKQKWDSNNPLKRKAQHTANNAIRDGKLVRKLACEYCGCQDKVLHKHHWSYLEEHWLDVIFLCPKCHGKEHKRLNALGRDPDNQAGYAGLY